MKKRKNVRVVLTGGHAATTAYAVVEELVRREGKKHFWDIYWIGAQKAVEGTSVETLESKIFSKVSVKKYTIRAGRLQRKFTLWTIPAAAKIPLGFAQAFFLLLRIRPDVILSFGGFAALPVVFAGYLLRVPVILHDQTGGIGRANKLSLPFAKKVAVARESALTFLPKDKGVVVGNPVMTQITEITPKEVIGRPPTIYITGGSRGARYLNEVVKNALPKLIKKYIIIHQVGELDYDDLLQIRSTFDRKMRERYEVYKNIDPMQVDGVYKRSDIIVARAGANTVSEIMIVKRPAILVPLPISAVYDQPANAKLAFDFGIAQVVEQGNLTPNSLISQIGNIKTNWREYVNNVKGKKSMDTDAAQKLVDILEKFLPN